MLTAYALWCVVNWFDAFVLDCIWFCHDKHFVIPGTEDMVADYHDYWKTTLCYHNFLFMISFYIFAKR